MTNRAENVKQIKDWKKKKKNPLFCKNRNTHFENLKINWVLGRGSSNSKEK